MYLVCDPLQVIIQTERESSLWEHPVFSALVREIRADALTG